MRVLLVGLVMAIGLCASNALAEDCSQAENQADMTACAGQQFEQADSELNQSYKQIMARLKNDPDTAKLLVAAQKAWIAFRDAECTFSSSASADGSIYPMLVVQCREGLTAIASRISRPI